MSEARHSHQFVAWQACPLKANYRASSIPISSSEGCTEAEIRFRSSTRLSDENLLRANMPEAALARESEHPVVIGVIKVVRSDFWSGLSSSRAKLRTSTQWQSEPIKHFFQRNSNTHP